jgi:ATP-dependent exoDNAse (exonuclease V) beta subunit
MLKPILSTKNAHPRDPNLVFDEPTHKYTILTDPHSKYTSVTTWNHSHFPHFDADAVIRNMMSGKNWNPDNKYWGLTPKEIKAQWAQNGAAVSGAGTNLHFDIECFMNQELPPNTDYIHRNLLENYETQTQTHENQSDEWGFFLQYVKANPRFKPYRTEWMIYDEELKLAGSIDMVYENPDGTLTIYDWKRAKEITKRNNFGKTAITECVKHLPDTNYWHYSLQLNTYKAILEKQYGKKVTDLYLVRLHPNNEQKTYELIQCADLSQEIADLFELRLQKPAPPPPPPQTPQTQQPQIPIPTPEKKLDQKTTVSFFRKINLKN